MSSFVRAWVRFLFAVLTLALVTVAAREAKAWPGPVNLNGSAGSGYITSAWVSGGAGCISCHGDYTAVTGLPTPHQPWTATSLTPAIAISGTGTGTTHVTNSDGNGGIFTVQPGALATFTLTFKTLTGFGGSGGFLVYHNDGTNNSAGTLIPQGSEHACKESSPDAACGTGINPPEIPGNNTEVMHSVPQLTFSGNLAFTFGYQAPSVCSGSFSFTLWFNAENGDSNCGTPDSSYPITFTVNIAACNDNNACTSGDFCFAGSCFSGTATTCTALDQCHNAGVCNTSNGVCSNPVRTGLACDDGNACTNGDSCNAGGTCVAGSPTVCSAIDQCHNAGTCNTGTGVCANPVRTGLACDDGNACTNGDTCSAGGTCVAGTPTVCTALDQCHSAGTCNTGNGACTNPTLTGTSCSDGNSCTVGDTCNAGVCQSGPGMTCPASDQCHGPSTCSAGVCSTPAPLTGVACNDGNACTTGESCNAGVCNGGSAVGCNDGNVCTTDSCNPASGCQHPAAPSGTVCRDGSRGPCDVVVTCGGSTTCPGFDVDHTNKQCSPPSCTSNIATPAEQCDGSNFTCPTATPVACAPAVCSGNACSGGCAGDDSLCTTGNYCLSNVCTPKKANGLTCSGANQCANGNCVDGVCCNTACGGGDTTDCQACNLAATKGTCTVPVGTVCRSANGNICDADELCQAGNTACPTDLPAAANKVCRASSDGNICDPAETCGGAFTCPADTPTRDGTACTNDGNVCSLDLCESNVCTHDQPAGTGVVCRASGGVCDPAENCPAVGTSCPADARSGSSVVCRANAAGTNCDTPEVCGTNGVNCPADSFQGTAVSCRAPSCSSGTGTVAANCPGNAASCPTLVTKDCTPYVCQGTACGTTCGVKTDCDVGFYCNPANKCVPELTPGAACTTAASCGTGICVDGVCCNSQCTGQCQACDIPGKAGVCSPVPATDKVPHGSRAKCTGDASACHGFCDGTNTAACALPGATTQCLAPSCTNGVATPVEVCNGSGTCPTQPTVPCAPGVCQAPSGPKAICVGGGGTPCTADVECVSDHYCLVGQCKPKNPDGNTCSADDQCTNGHCVDGLCCNSGCDGQCEACNVQGKLGTCSPITLGDIPHSGRPVCNSDAQFTACAGQCDGKNRLACVYPGAGTLCRDASCTNDIATLPAYCTGTGTCSPPQQQACDAGNGCNTTGTLCSNGCTADRDCSLGKYCAGGVCVPTVPQGQPCSSSGQCTGACVDGVCCNTTCDHQCEACNVPTKLGICTAVTGAPVLPRAGCATDGTAACVGKCNGVNKDACTFPGTTTQCAAGACADGVATLTDFCDGSGSCPAAQNQICAPADCSGTKCGGDCATTGTCPAGAYCSAGVCVTKLPPKLVCAQDSDCANGLCTDGYCCDSACTGQCQACDVPGSLGVCTTLTGDLPHGGRAACAGFGACAAVCDGTSATQCSYAGPTTTCGKSSCAVNGEQLGAPLCNGAGACLPAPTTNCGSYTCDPPSGQCLTSCVLATDCAAGFDCINAKCVAGTDAGVAVDAGAGGAPDMPDASTTPDASVDATAPDTGTDAATTDSGAAGESDGGPVLVPPGHSTDKGSCGCSVPGSESNGSNVAILAALGLLGVAGRRRRRKAAQPDNGARL